MATERTSHPDPDDQAGNASEFCFRTQLEAFGGRASRLCRLLRAGRLSPDACFLALTQLWIQLAQAHRRLGDESDLRPDPVEGDHRPGPPAR